MRNDIAQIIINNPNSELDKPFSYKIPDIFLDKIKIGSRVLVPFGNGNMKIEGYVINLTDISEFAHLKEISDIVGDYPILNERLIELAKWMRDEYVCTYLDCLKCIAPTGIGIKNNKTVILRNEVDISSVKGSVQIRVIEILKDNNGSLDYDELCGLVGSKTVANSIKKLEETGIVIIENTLTSSVRDKKIRVAVLNISADDAVMINENLSERFSAQKRVLNILIDNDYMSVADLARFADTSHQAINSLEKKGIIKFEEIEVSRDPFASIEYKKSNPLPLTKEQTIALGQIKDSIVNNMPDKYLVHGITGSGKTEVYLQAIDEVINLGGQAIVLVPEIALTPQMVERFKSRFGEQVAVIHSRLSLGERYDQWKKIKHGEVSVVVGARSAIFAPFSNLKLIIIDEEHETSYKSEAKPKYSAKTVAEKRSELENCVIVLGSATPSMDTFYEMQSGKYKLIEMTKRVKESILPEVEVIDLKQELEEGNRSIFSRKLFEEISSNIEKNEQTILFLNRRGYSTFVSCRQCGHVLTCPNCSISLTYHSYNNQLLCHYCGFEERNPNTCPSCQSKYIKYFGIGTQKVEDEVKRMFPNATVLRMDVDTTSTKFAHQRILDTFKNENINILIGTQMIAKGLDFPNVTLVGVIAADTSLNIDDFRASERTFQLLTQVAGRAGRGEKQGRVIVQTYQPDNFSIQTAQNHDYHTFYESEIVIRRNLDYPPFTDLVSIIVSHSENDTAKFIAYECEKRLKKGFENIKEINQNDYIIFNPTPAPLSKIKHVYRWRLLVKIKSAASIKGVLRDIERELYENAHINIDINGINML